MRGGQTAHRWQLVGVPAPLWGHYENIRNHKKEKLKYKSSCPGGDQKKRKKKKKGKKAHFRII